MRLSIPHTREVCPEILDSLDHDDPIAKHSRGELRLANHIMGNFRWMCRRLRTHGMRHKRVLELGAGDGTLAKHALGNRLVSPESWHALDLAPAPADWSKNAVWHQCDLFSLPRLPEAEIIVANLFLHHFHDHQLSDLGTRLPESCRYLVACEPARHWLLAILGQMLSKVVRFSPVTHHDMVVSIRAGFAGNELHQALGLSGWHSRTSITMRGVYHFEAWR